MKRKLLSLLLSVSLLLAVVVPVGPTYAQAGETVTVSVTYQYASDGTMVARPYIATIEKGANFQAAIAIPEIANYSITADSAGTLPAGFSLDTDSSLLFIDLKSVTENVDVVLQYEAGKAVYTVKHMVQILGSDAYEQEGQSIELTGDIGMYTEAVAKQKPGFFARVEQAEIAADGTTEVIIWYDRLSYTVVFDPNGGVNAPAPIYAEYGEPIESEYVTAPTRQGYVFKGWSPEIEYTVTKNVTYVAQWESESGIADYSIVLWGQNANDDEYSFIHSYPAWGEAGTEVSWDEGRLICEGIHVHKESCYERTCGLAEHNHTQEGCNIICGKEEHIHSAACCTKEEHTHGTSCYEGVGRPALTGDMGKPENPSEGEVYRGLLDTYIYIQGTWYDYSGNTASSSIATTICGKDGHTHGDGNCSCPQEEHTHTDACYGCGVPEHTHTDYTGSCYTLICTVTGHDHHTTDCYMSSLHPGKNLWEFERSDTVTIDAAGNTVLNVYFTRKEFTLTFLYDWHSQGWGGEYRTTKTITDRWGAYIKEEYEAVVDDAGGSMWTENYSGDGPYTNYIGIMPTKDMAYYQRSSESGRRNIMTYYGEDLDGDYQVIFTMRFYGDGYTVTKEDFYAFEGYTFNAGRSTKEGADCDGATFYYDRNPYSLKFFSGDNNAAIREEEVLYQQPLGEYTFKPTTPPAWMEKDAEFVGWYLNPECTGEEYRLEGHAMPAGDVALYAKWVNGVYTVKTYTDASLKELYTYEGYDGVQSDIVKYTLAQAPTDPAESGVVFVGWFYEENGMEKPFSFTMPITKDYSLYPKFSNQAMVSYTVHYYIEDTETQVADDKTGHKQIGSVVTEQAKTGKQLNLAGGKDYVPLNLSTSMILTEEGMEIIFYYQEAADVTYTVAYVDPQNRPLHAPVTKTTNESVVTEYPVSIPGYTPRLGAITQGLSLDAEENYLIFVYDPDTTSLTIEKTGAQAVDENQTFLFRVKGADDTTAEVDVTVAIHGNGSATIADLPIGAYAVAELTDWSWRYTPEEKSQTISLQAGGDNRLTFSNQRTSVYWLDGDDYAHNRFDPKTP